MGVPPLVSAPGPGPGPRGVETGAEIGVRVGIGRGAELSAGGCSELLPGCSSAGGAGGGAGVAVAATAVVKPENKATDATLTGPAAGGVSSSNNSSSGSGSGSTSGSNTKTRELKNLELGMAEPFLISKSTDQDRQISADNDNGHDKKRLIEFKKEFERLGFCADRMGANVFVGVGVAGGATARILKELKTANLTVTTDILRETRIVHILRGDPPDCTVSLI